MDRYYEDYPVGLVTEVGSFSVSAEEIIAFAREFDPQSFHVDAQAAKASMFGGLVASGWHTTARMMRLIVDEYLSPASSLGSPGVDELRWIAPLRPDVVVAVSCEVLEARPSASKPDRGVVRNRMTLTDPDGAPVMTAVATNLLPRRPGPCRSTVTDR